MKLLDELLNMNHSIINKLSNLTVSQTSNRTAYSDMCLGLYNDISKIIGTLTYYKNSPHDFFKVLMDVNKHWYNYLNDPFIATMKSYGDKLIALDNLVMSQQRDLILLASEHPDNIVSQNKEIDELASRLGDILTPAGEIIILMGKTKLGSSTKKPSRQRRPTKGITKRISSINI